MAINQSELSAIYVGLLGRPLDGSGQKFWIDQANTLGHGISQTFQSVVTNPAVVTYLGNRIETNQQFVEHLYLNLFGKTTTEDNEGITFWVDQLNSGTSRGDIVDGIIRAGANPVLAQDKNEVTRTSHIRFINRVRVSNIVGDITNQVDLANGLDNALAPYQAIQQAITGTSTVDDFRTIILKYASQIKADVGRLPSSSRTQNKAKVIRELTGAIVGEDYDKYTPPAPPPDPEQPTPPEKPKDKPKVTEKSTISPILDSMLAKRLDSLELDAKAITNGSVLSKKFGNVDRLFWDGSGPFDIFMRALDENIRSQADNGRIEGPDYGTVYVKLVELALTKAIEVETLNQEFKIKVLEAKLKAAQMEEELKFKKKELAFKEKQLEAELTLTGLKQENLREQTKIYARQVEGFSDNLKLKLFQAQLETFGLIYSQGVLDFDENSTQFPEVLKASKLSEAYNMLHQSAIAKWEYDPLTNKSKYTVENRIKAGGPESPIKM